MDKKQVILFSFLGLIVLLIVAYLLYNWHTTTVSNAATTAATTAAAQTAATGSVLKGASAGISTATANKNTATAAIIGALGGIGLGAAAVSLFGGGGSSTDNPVANDGNGIDTSTLTNTPTAVSATGLTGVTDTSPAIGTVDSSGNVTTSLGQVDSSGNLIDTTGTSDFSGSGVSFDF